jgi:hypothetical protein
MDTSQAVISSSTEATAANDLRTNQKKFKHQVRLRASIVNALFALQYRNSPGTLGRTRYRRLGRKDDVAGEVCLLNSCCLLHVNDTRDVRVTNS